MHDLLTVKEVALQYGVTTRTVRNWITNGKVTAYKRCGHALLVDAQSVDRVLELVITRY